MLLMICAALVLASLLLRRRALLEGTTEMIEPAGKTVKATVDGKPVHSYVMMDSHER